MTAGGDLSTAPPWNFARISLTAVGGGDAAGSRAPHRERANATHHRMDLKPPKLDGLAVLQAAHACHKNIPIVAFRRNIRRPTC
jgi:hypothetical protein